MAGPIRQKIDLKSLERYIERDAPAIKTPLEVKQFGFGQSNPTYLLTDSKGAKYVMRKKPPGKLLSATAHRVDREYRIIHALDGTDVPVPKAICLCEDESVIGTAFYIMEFLDGRIFQDPAIPGVEPDERREIWRDAVRTLAKFHNVKPASVGLQDFGKHGGFYNRQLKLFNSLTVTQGNTKDVESHKPVGQIPHFEDLVKFFTNPKTQPKDRVTFVHGDYKIDNMVFHKTEPRVIGILDWEMSTIGHPLSDLGNFVMPFTTASNANAQNVGSSGRGSKDFLPGATPGLPTQQDILGWYHEVAGWDPTKEITWASAFGIYRGAIIMQGIAARYAVRQASSDQAKLYGSWMGPYALVAWDLVQEQQKKNEESSQAKL